MYYIICVYFKMHSYVYNCIVLFILFPLLLILLLKPTTWRNIGSFFSLFLFSFHQTFISVAETHAIL